jgi:eukaryotic-like serine/threonine-protein kinase
MTIYPPHSRIAPGRPKLASRFQTVSDAELWRPAEERPRQRMDSAYGPYHDRIGEAVAGFMTAERERRVHEQLARALDTAHEPDIERVALHFKGAGLREETCVRARLAAERAAVALTFDRAARLYQCVIDWSRSEPGAVAELEQSRGEALADCGRGLEAALAFARAVPGASADRASTLRIRIAAELLRGGG